MQGCRNCSPWTKRSQRLCSVMVVMSAMIYLNYVLRSMLRFVSLWYNTEMDEDTGFRLTPEGLALARRIVSMYREGMDIEVIAAEIDEPVSAIQVLIALMGNE